ncbi:hypothetical protein C7M84_016634 [Penaeus vannamei]|uniref:RING-type domain-containing protein n=1 Tax=Penaeus vannamei TaxID=6689 RepID=A0A423SMK8_PENVA|nr:hypothetical protein C7M84_016634 [Penaeus vannamei]
MESQETLDCPLCQEQYDMATKVPILMPCQHTVCESCVLRLVISREPTSEVTESGPIYENIHANAPRANASLDALANVIRQHPPLRKSRDRSFAHRSVSLPYGDSAPLSAGAGPKPRAQKAAIPEEKRIQCPVCRTAINTSSLQTNRYVVAHMRAVGRLGTAPPAPRSEFLPVNFWKSLAYKQLLLRGCAGPCQILRPPGWDPLLKDITPTCTMTPFSVCLLPSQWVEDMRANKKDSLNTLSKLLREHTTEVDNLESIVKTALHALSLASRKLWSDRQALQEVGESLKALQENGSPGQTLAKQAISLSKEMEALSQVERFFPAAAGGAGSEEVALRPHGGGLLISTQNPDRSVLVNISEGNSGPSGV